MERNVDIDRKGFAFDILERFNEFRNNNTYCDFTIHAGGIDIPVHKFVIAANSDYFHAMLSHDTKEKQDGIAEIKESDPECVVKCVNFMYTGKATVSEDKQGELMHVANMFQLRRLCDGLAEFLVEELNADSYFLSREIASLYNCQRLMKVCDKFAGDNFHAIMKHDRFKELDEKHMLFLLSSNDTKALDAVKCKAVVAWASYDSTRSGKLSNLMQYINFSNVPMSYCRYLVEKESVISNSNECLKLIMNSLFRRANTKDAEPYADPNTGIIICDRNNSRLKGFNIKTTSWIEMQPIWGEIVNSRCSAVAIDCYMYCLIYDYMYRIKFVDNEAKWEHLQPAPRSQYGGPIGVCNRSLYVTSYEDDSKLLLKYDTGENKWYQLPDKELSCQGSSVAVANGDVYVVGGCTHYRKRFSDVERFCPSTSTWTPAPSLTEPRSNCSACTLGDTIFVFGGFHGGDYDYAESVELLRSNAVSWETVRLPGFRRADFKCEPLDQKIYLVCGSQTDSFDEKGAGILEYDPKKKSLTTLVVPEVELGNFSSVAVVM